MSRGMSFSSLFFKALYSLHNKDLGLALGAIAVGYL
jgi:hypothetical protein